MASSSHSSRLLTQYDSLKKVESVLISSSSNNNNSSSDYGSGTQQQGLSSESGSSIAGGVRDWVDVSNDLYLRFKQEVRLLLGFKHSLEVGKIAKTMGEHFQPEKKFHIEFSDVAQFDAEFNLDFKNQAESYKQILIRRLGEYKDKIMFELLNSTLDELGIDMIGGGGSNSYMPPVLAAELPEFKLWTKFFNVLQTFRSLAKFKKRSEISKNEGDLQIEVALKQLEINDMKEALNRKAEQIKDMSYQLQQILVESGRNQLMSRQQDTITQLEMAASKFNKQMQELLESNRNLALENGILKDEMNARSSQLDALKTLYKDNIETMKPAVEGEIYKASIEQRQIAALKNEIDVYQFQIKKLVQQTQLQVSDVDSKNKKIDKYERIISQQEVMLQKANAEAKRQSNLKMVAVAAKMKFEKLFKEANENTKKAIAEKDVVEEAKIIIEEELVEMENYIETLQVIVEKAENNVVLLDEKFNMANAEKRAFELSCKQLSEELGSSFTSEQKELLESTIKSQQEQILRIQSQVRAANKRVYDLEDELSKKM